MSVTDVPTLMNKLEELVGIQLSPLTDFIVANLSEGKHSMHLICLDMTIEKFSFEDLLT